MTFCSVPLQEVDVNGIKFWCYNAGHVLGAAMFMIEIAGVKVLYTGDFSRVEDRHLMAAEIPSVTPDIVITVSRGDMGSGETKGCGLLWSYRTRSVHVF